MEMTSKQPTRPCIIVIDDDDAVRNSLKFLLEVEGFAVYAFPAGVDLLRETDLPDCSCLIIDQNMPQMSGLNVVATLRNRSFATPIILITGQPNDAVRNKATSAGISLVEKPLLGNVLIDRIRAVTA